MEIDNKKSKMTLDKLARMTQNEFSVIEKALETKATKDDLKLLATKEDLKLFATKAELKDMKDTIIGEVRTENQKVLQSSDKVITKLDILLKDASAHNLLHKRIDDELHTHDKRIKKLEAVVKVYG